MRLTMLLYQGAQFLFVSTILSSIHILYAQPTNSLPLSKEITKTTSTVAPSCLGLKPVDDCQSTKARGDTLAASSTNQAVLHTRNNKDKNMNKISPKGDVNVLGTPLKECCSDPLTGFERDGFCHTGSRDRGRHVVCAIMTEEFLTYTKGQGNDLSTPLPHYGFPGLKPGDKWCLCALRWAEAHRADVAPLVDLEATHSKALEYISLPILKSKAWLTKK